MLMNLVLHARAAMPDGGRLTIETRNETTRTETAQREESVGLTVTHTGETPDLENLFDPSSPENLGLSIAQEIAVEHGGCLSAQRTVEGGVRFDALLPRWKEPAALPDPDTAARASVLLIEANALIRRHLHNFFEANGYNLLEAQDAAEAATLCELCPQQPDLVIADSGEADSLSESYPGLTVLHIVADDPRGPGEIRRPFTQSVLLERVITLLQHQGARAAADYR